MVDRVFLVGMPYAGKTYWGRLVAGHYGLPFNDLDEVVSREAGKAIHEIFDEQGEAHFRRAEHTSLMRLIAQPVGGVVSCGGGTPCYRGNMASMRDAGITVYLQASPEYLLANRERSAVRRPLFGEEAPTPQQLAALMKERERYYLQAHYILQAADISVATFAQILNHV